MRIVHRLLLLLVGITGLRPGATWAQEVRAVTVDESVRLGLTHNAMLRATRADAVEAHAVYREARSARLPSLSTHASYMRLSDNIPEISFSTDFLPGADSSFTLAPVELNRYYAEIAVEQPLFTGFRLHNQVRSARLQADAASYQTSQEEADVAFQIRQAYWNLYHALAVHAATDEALAQVEAHLRDVQNQRDVGAALASDVLAVQTRRSEVELERIEAANAVHSTRLELNRLTGLALDTEIRIDSTVTIEPLPENVEALITRALDSRPGLEALGAQVEAFDAQVDASRGDWLPQVALTGRYVYARPNQYFFIEQDVFRATWEAGVTMRWNLFDGGAKLAETQQARARLEGAEARLAAAREAVAVEVMRQYLEVRRASEAVAVAARNVEESEESLRVLRTQYTEGAVLSAQVLDAELAFRTAQTRRARATADYAIARAALLNALGQIW